MWPEARCFFPQPSREIGKRQRTRNVRRKTKAKLSKKSFLK